MSPLRDARDRLIRLDNRTAKITSEATDGDGDGDDGQDPSVPKSQHGGREVHYCILELLAFAEAPVRGFSRSESQGPHAALDWSWQFFAMQSAGEVDSRCVTVA